jgi:hypothetical protein
MLRFLFLSVLQNENQLLAKVLKLNHKAHVLSLNNLAFHFLVSVLHFSWILSLSM